MDNCYKLQGTWPIASTATAPTTGVQQLQLPNCSCCLHQTASEAPAPVTSYQAHWQLLQGIWTTATCYQVYGQLIKLFQGTWLASTIYQVLGQLLQVTRYLDISYKLQGTTASTATATTTGSAATAAKIAATVFTKQPLKLISQLANELAQIFCQQQLFIGSRFYEAMNKINFQRGGGGREKLEQEQSSSLFRNLPR